MAGGGDDRYEALGRVVEAAAVMEIALRMAYCALTGGEYAALVADGQEAHWLIDSCDVVARHHGELNQASRDAIRQALRACRDASRDRNRLVHDAWNLTADGRPVTVASRARSYEIAGRPWAVDDIKAVAAGIAAAQRELLGSVEDALGPDRLDAARHELAAGARDRRF
jgi:hypothetical protein